MSSDDKELFVLILEDVPADAEPIQRELRKAGLSFAAVRVDTREDFLRAIGERAPDSILADYRLPKFDGLAVLAIAREKCPEAPFVFVTGTMGDEQAVEALRQGADDYILKDRLSRLGPAVLRALEDARGRKEQQAAEAKLHEQLDELRRFEKVAIGREQRMQELKEALIKYDFSTQRRRERKGRRENLFE
jgi:DNA-binding NtrC family response regulator